MNTEKVRIGAGIYDQTLIEGIEPLCLTQRDLAALRAAKAAKQSKHAPMPEGGLWDECAKNQLNLF
jgi:hypothetical protein